MHLPTPHSPRPPAEPAPPPRSTPAQRPVEPRRDEGQPDRHARKVARIAQQLRDHPAGVPVKIKKKQVSHQVPKASSLRRKDVVPIDVTDLTEILEIDPMARTCTAESGVAFVDLVEATLAHGLVPTVVPELKTITLGGAVAGCSIESMSYQYGGFHDSCLEYELVTGDGEVLTCTPDGDNRLIFEMMHGTFGTLGILTRLRFRLVPALPFVHVTYWTYSDFASYEAAIRRHFAARDVDFMDGILHAPDRLVLCTGRFVDKAPYTHKYDWMRVYFRSTARRGEDYLRTQDYFFRYDKGVTHVNPKSLVGRLLLGKFTGSSQVLRLADKAGFLLSAERPRVTLDVFLPVSKAAEFLRWYGEDVGFFPLWCVPYRVVHRYEWLSDEFHARSPDDLFLDLAIYGMPQRPGRNEYRVLEEKLTELGGVKTLISHNFYSEAEFWRIWNRPNYERVKARTDPRGVFLDLFRKTCGRPDSAS